MVFSLTPLIVLVASVVVVGMLLRRRLPRPGKFVGVSCVRCGTPGAALAYDSFLCPGCGRDVREAGLAPAQGRSPRSLWLVMLFTVAVMVVAAITAGVAAQAAPRVEGISSESALGAPRSGAYVGVLVTSARSARRRPSQEWTSQTLAELTTLDGRATLLEVEGPSTGWLVTSDDGRAVEQGRSLDEDAVLRWYRAAGVDTADERVRAEAAEVFAVIAAGSSLRVGGGAGFYSRNTRNNSSSGPVTWVAAWVIAAWSVVWVSGVWALLSATRAGAAGPTSAAPSVGPAARGVSP